MTESALAAGRSSADRLDAAALYSTLAGLCGSLVAIGLARFAYTPLIPALIQAHWFSPAQTVTLGAANFAGYLAGAMAGRPIAGYLGNRAALRLLMLIATVAFFTCAYPFSVLWFFVWRFASGLSGGAIMVLVATSILPHIPPARRGVASGLIFLGLGLGIAASGTLVPLLLKFGLQATWFGLGSLALGLTLVSWFGWPATMPAIARQTMADLPRAPQRAHSLPLLYGQYAANALGLVPAMMLLVDYVARGLGRGAVAGAEYWVLYGLAACAGPIVCGAVADRLGFALAYRIALLLQAFAGVMLAISGQPVCIAMATVVLGAFTPGVVPLVLGRIQELIPHDPTMQRAAWSRATTGFALLQALGGYGYSYLFTQFHEDYSLVFLCGVMALLLAFLADLLARSHS